MQNNGAGLNTCCISSIIKPWLGTTPITTEWSPYKEKSDITFAYSLSSPCKSDWNKFRYKIFVKYQEVRKLEFCSLSHFIATFLFSIEARNCSNNSFFISRFRRMSIEISSAFWQHSLTARTIFDIVSELNSQFSRFKSTEDRLRSFRRQLAK